MGKQGYGKIEKRMGRQGFAKTGRQVDGYILCNDIGKHVSRWNDNQIHVKQVNRDIGKQ